MYNRNESDYQKVHKHWKKNKSFAIMNSGYHKYFGISATAMSQDSEFEVQDDATKSQIKSAFTKSLRNKKMNKKVLSEFIVLIA
jgi:ribosomal protein L23